MTYPLNVQVRFTVLDGGGITSCSIHEETETKRTNTDRKLIKILIIIKLVNKVNRINAKYQKKMPRDFLLLKYL